MIVSTRDEDSKAEYQPDFWPEDGACSQPSRRRSSLAPAASAARLGRRLVRRERPAARPAIWTASVKTATDMVARRAARRPTPPGRPCAIALPEVLLDGAVARPLPLRRRPGGDRADAARLDALRTHAVLRDMILWYARNQHDDGAIPASPDAGRVTTSSSTTTPSGSRISTTTSSTPATSRWRGRCGRASCGCWTAGTRRRRASAAARELARRRSTTPTSRARGRRSPTTTPGTCSRCGSGPRLAALGRRAGPRSGLDARGSRRSPPRSRTPSGTRRRVRTSTRPPARPCTPRTGTRSPILAGLRHPRPRPLGARLPRPTTTRSPTGRRSPTTTTWDGYPWGFQASKRVYPFMSYFEVLARLRGRASTPRRSTLIRREWGWMLANGPAGRCGRRSAPAGRPRPGRTLRGTTAGRAARRRR